MRVTVKMTERQTKRSGLIIAAHGRRGRLETESGDRLPYLVQGRRLRVVCGDRVDWVSDDRGKLAVGKLHVQIAQLVLGRVVELCGVEVA